jgi:hypothetical protein
MSQGIRKSSEKELLKLLRPSHNNEIIEMEEDELVLILMNKEAHIWDRG